MNIKPPYHVIEIIDNKTILIDYGFENGAAKGDRLRIYSVGERVTAPDGTILGTLDPIKAVVAVETAYPQFSICIKPEVWAPFATAMEPFTQAVSENQKGVLNVDPQAMTHRKMPVADVIRVGDPAVVLPGN